MAQLAIDMDQDGPEHPLQGEDAYFNGCHSRCAGYETLALFVYHTAMHHILRLAMMEVKSESTHEISIFWELFNEILSKIKGRNYKFNPKSIMVDENGANYCAIRKVFGLEFATSKVVSCRMHYKNDVNRASLKISDSYKDVFKNICHKMCSVTTVAEYNCYVRKCELAFTLSTRSKITELVKGKFTACMYGALSLHNPAHLQVHCSLQHLGRITKRYHSQDSNQ